MQKLEFFENRKMNYVVIVVHQRGDNWTYVGREKSEYVDASSHIIIREASAVACDDIAHYPFLGY
jgi:hypothetical protein